MPGSNFGHTRYLNSVTDGRHVRRPFARHHDITKTTQGITSRSFIYSLTIQRQELTSAIHQVVVPQTSDSHMSCRKRRPTLPRIIRQLPCLDSVRVAGTQRNDVASAAFSRSAAAGDSTIQLAPETTSRTKVSEIRDDIRPTRVAQEVTEPEVCRHTTSNKESAANRCMPRTFKSVTSKSAVRVVRQAAMSHERFVRGNAPNIGGSHEKRNVDQRSSAGREPDWRC